MQMDSAYHPHQHVDAFLLGILSRTDTSIWCYIPLDQNAPLRCSEGFRRLWQLGGVVEPTTRESSSIENRSWLAQSLHHFGIKPCLFFELIANVAGDATASESCMLVRNDHRQLQLAILPLIQQHLIRGHLLRMTDLAQSSLIDALLQDVNEARKKLDVLSQREAEILELVYAGRTNKAISITTTISEKTVEKHRARIMQKLSLLSTAELIRLVTRARLFDDLKKAHQIVPNSSGLIAGLYTGGHLRESA